MTTVLQLHTDDVAETIAEVRAQLLDELAAAIKAPAHAGDHIAALRAVDRPFRDGRDIATFVNDSRRYLRAAHSVIEHTICEQATAC
jgi:hypothetical protein